MVVPFADKCSLRIPYPNASSDEQHFENYKEIQRWSDRFQRDPDCMPSGCCKLPFYVAASDASDKSKALSDYICTGTADQTTIQEAVDDLAAYMTANDNGLLSSPYTGSFDAGVGATLIFSEGTFVLSDDVELGDVPGPMNVRGQGYHATRLRASTTGVDAFLLQGTTASFSDMAFMGMINAIYDDTGLTDGDSMNVTRCWIEDGRWGIFLYEGGEHLSITDCHFFSLSEQAIYLRFWGDSHINSNTFFGCETAIYLDETYRIEVRGNITSGTTDYFVDGGGAVDGLTITNNQATVQESAVRLAGPASFPPPLVGLVVADNFFVGDAGDKVINISGWADSGTQKPAMISDNNVHGLVEIGYRCVVTGNFINGGITIIDPATDALVSNNWLGDSGTYTTPGTITDSTTGTIVNKGAGNYLDGTWT